jgi:hypothetical protein
MKRAFEDSTTTVMPYKMIRRPVSIKAGDDHIRAFITPVSSTGLDRANPPSIPEALVIESRSRGVLSPGQAGGRQERERLTPSSSRP